MPLKWRASRLLSRWALFTLLSGVVFWRWSRRPPCRAPASSPEVFIVAACQNRHGTLADGVWRSWMESSVSGIVLVDWSSEPELVEELPPYRCGPPVRIVRVLDQPIWRLSWAYNLGASFVKPGSVLLKLDCDTKLTPEFLDHHPPQKGFWYSGNWETAPDKNSIHLNGVVMIHKDDFQSLGGYDERFQTYGFEDSDLYSRIEERGLARLALNTSFIQHVPHVAKLRFANQENVYSGKFEDIKNKLLRMNAGSWNRTAHHVEYDIRSSLFNSDRYTARVTRTCPTMERFVPKSMVQSLNRESAIQTLEGIGFQRMQVANMTTDYLLRLVRTYSGELMIAIHVQGSLSERLLALGSAMALTTLTGRHLRIIWPKSRECDAAFGDLFDARAYDVYDRFEPAELAPDLFEKYDYINRDEPVRINSLRHIYIKARGPLRHWFMKPLTIGVPLNRLQPSAAVGGLLGEVKLRNYVGVNYSRGPRGPESAEIDIVNVTAQIRNVAETAAPDGFFLSARTIDHFEGLQTSLPKINFASIPRIACKCCAELADLLMLSRARLLLGDVRSISTRVAAIMGNMTVTSALSDGEGEVKDECK
ncbi:hypothetical protein DFJ74DRAFT_641053 [Hyaloraphidium curvatum]|nr:hypothetical protein DFJ74DRAFT_641053 [Hyaloraphidium curvatum]